MKEYITPWTLVAIIALLLGTVSEITTGSGFGTAAILCLFIGLG